MNNAMMTGASGGIGLATANLLAKEGYGLTSVARNKAKLKSSVSSLEGKDRPSCRVCDLSDRGSGRPRQAAPGDAAGDRPAEKEKAVTATGMTT